VRDHQLLQINGKSTPARRNSQYEKRLASILKAASKVIARDGYEGASVREVAARAKIGLSGIYYYFKSKDELLYALQHHAFTTLNSTLRERLKKAATPEEKLKAVIDNHFDYFANNMDNLKVCVHEIESLSGKYYRSVLEVRQEYFRLVQRAVGEVAKRRNYGTNLAALALFGSLNWIYMWYDPQKNPDIDKVSDQFLKVFLNGIKAS
jgi:AcrR family transcriptional regulator